MPGKHFKMTNDALENYGEQYRDVILEVTHEAKDYMPADQFYASGQPEGFHPGYDSETKSTLFDLKRVDTGEPLSFSLYRHELVPA